MQREATTDGDPGNGVEREGSVFTMRARLGTTWCISESGLAGPTGAPAGRTTIGVSGPVTRTEVFETGLSDRGANMVEFTTLALRYLRDAIVEVGICLMGEGDSVHPLAARSRGPLNGGAKIVRKRARFDSPRP